MSDVLVKLALEKLAGEVPSAATLLPIAVELAKAVNGRVDLKGAEKTALVQKALRELLEVPIVKEKLDDTVEAALKDCVEHIVPVTITLIVSASRGDLTFKKVQAGCFSMIFSCITAAATRVAVPAPAAAVPVTSASAVEMIVREVVSAAATETPAEKAVATPAQTDEAKPVPV
jgi:hypothetical protein